jgi:sulfur-carrier protein
MGSVIGRIASCLAGRGAGELKRPTPAFGLFRARIAFCKVALKEPSVAKIAFTAHLAAVGPTQAVRYGGATLAEVLDAVGADYPQLLGYLLDDQGRIRKHIAIFIDGLMRPRETALAAPLDDASDVYVFQALSGG